MMNTLLCMVQGDNRTYSKLTKLSKHSTIMAEEAKEAMEAALKVYREEMKEVRAKNRKAIENYKEELKAAREKATSAVKERSFHQPGEAEFFLSADIEAAASSSQEGDEAAAAASSSQEGKEGDEAATAEALKKAKNAMKGKKVMKGVNL